MTIDSAQKAGRPLAAALDHLRAKLQVWRARYRYRQQLARWSERELHDIGLSPASVEYEVNKPFWRA